MRGMSRAARIATFGHLSTRDAATLDAEAMEAAASDERPFCGVLGCQTHVGDRRATLSAVLEELRPEMRREHATIEAATPGYLCAGDLPEDVVERILGIFRSEVRERARVYVPRISIARGRDVTGTGVDFTSAPTRGARMDAPARTRSSTADCRPVVETNRLRGRPCAVVSHVAR